MKKKKNNLAIVLIILIILVLGLSGFIVYDKVLNSEDNNVVDNNQENENNNHQVENKLNNIPSDIGNNTESTTYFSEYLKYIPLRYTNSELSDYNISNLTKIEISMSVWRYIWNNSNDVSERKVTEEEIDKYLNKYFDFTNFEVATMEIKDNHIFGLSKKDGYYVATVLPTEFSFANLEINNISYDKNTQKVIINADDCYYEMGSGEKTIISTVTIEFKKNENNFNIISFKVNK